MGRSLVLASTVATVERQARHAKREIRGVGGKSMSLFGRAAGAGKAVAAAMLEGVVGLFEGIFGAARPELNPEQKHTVQKAEQTAERAESRAMREMRTEAEADVMLRKLLQQTARDDARRREAGRERER